MKENKNGSKKKTTKGLSFEELLDDERFDEEDEDSVTDVTLEFLCLDDEMAESRQDQRGAASDQRKASARQYEDEDEDYGDDREDYEDDEDDEEDYEDDYYEDEEDYDEDEDYDDEEEYDYDDGRGGLLVRFKRYLTQISTLDMIVAMLGLVVIAGAVVSGSLYVNAKSVARQVETFASVGEQVEGISVIGESGLVAVSESARLASMIDMEETEEGEGGEVEAVQPEEEETKRIEVTVNLTSVQSDLKIKFVNKASGKLIGGVPFEVDVSSGQQSFGLKDEDKDGIIYQTGISAGTYQVTAVPFKEGEFESYVLPAASTSVKVTDTIAYKKVEVEDEVKTEAEVNAAVEDTAKQDTVEESTLQNTVEWVESTRTTLNEDENYQEIGKDMIPDPASISAAGGFRKIVETGDPGGTQTPQPASNEQPPDNQTPVTEQPADPGTSTPEPEPQPQSNPEPAAATCICTADDVKCTADHIKQGCTVCAADPSACPGKAAVETAPPVPVCTCDPNGIKCTADNKQKSDCPVCTGDPAQCVGTVVQQPPAQPAGYTITAVSCPSVMTVGSAGQATASISPAGGTFIWLSSDPNIVSIDPNTGLMIAKAIGTVSITAACDNSSQSASVTVENAKYTGITLSGTNKVSVGSIELVYGQTTPAGGTITWSSSDERILKIEAQNGETANFKGIAEGTAMVVAQCGEASATWTVTVVNGKAADNQTKLKDKNGNQVYVIKDGKYVEATYADYYVEGMKFYLLKASYSYTGWQTIDGSVYFYDKNGNYVTGEQVIQGAKYTFGSDGRLSSGSGSMGIDVSKWNGNIDWNAVKNSGVSFVIIRCGYRGSSTGALIEDPKFRSNIKGAKAAGLKVGLYFFSQAVNEVEAVEEASMAISLASGYGLNYPIFLDVEASGGRADGVSKETRTAVCKAFCATIQNSGYSTGIYANKTWLNDKIDAGSLTAYKIWLAQYASAPTYTATRYDMWQYSSKGKVSGISGNVDMNISYMSY